MSNKKLHEELKTPIYIPLNGYICIKELMEIVTATDSMHILLQSYYTVYFMDIILTLK